MNELGKIESHTERSMHAHIYTCMLLCITQKLLLFFANEKHWRYLKPHFFFLIFIAMVPEYWLTEGGQSATGALLDHIIENHVASPHLANRAASQSNQFVEYTVLKIKVCSCFSFI